MKCLRKHIAKNAEGNDYLVMSASAEFIEALTEFKSYFKPDEHEKIELVIRSESYVVAGELAYDLCQEKTLTEPEAHDFIWARISKFRPVRFAEKKLAKLYLRDKEEKKLALYANTDSVTYFDQMVVLKSLYRQNRILTAMNSSNPDEQKFAFRFHAAVRYGMGSFGISGDSVANVEIPLEYSLEARDVPGFKILELSKEGSKFWWKTTHGPICAGTFDTIDDLYRHFILDDVYAAIQEEYMTQRSEILARHAKIETVLELFAKYHHQRVTPFVHMAIRINNHQIGLAEKILSEKLRENPSYAGIMRGLCLACENDVLHDLMFPIMINSIDIAPDDLATYAHASFSNLRGRLVYEPLTDLPPVRLSFDMSNFKRLRFARMQENGEAGEKIILSTILNRLQYINAVLKTETDGAFADSLSDEKVKIVAELKSFGYELPADKLEIQQKETSDAPEMMRQETSTVHDMVD